MILPTRILTHIQRNPEAGVLVCGERDTRTDTVRMPVFGPTGWNVHDDCVIALKPGTIPELMQNYTTFIYYEVGFEYASPVAPVFLQPGDEARRWEAHQAKLQQWAPVHAAKPHIERYYPDNGLYVVGQFKYKYVQHLAETLSYFWTQIICVDLDKMTQKPVVELDPAKFSVLASFPYPFLVLQPDRPVSFKLLPEATVYYYAHEGVFPYLPYHCKVRGFFHAYLGAPSQFSRCHPLEMAQVSFSQLVPYAWDPHDFAPAPGHEFEARPKLIGFMGSIPGEYDPYDVEREDYLSVHVRDLRLKYLPLVEQLGGDVFDRKPFDVYVRFLQSTKVVVNITAIMGFLTERQFHAMGAGAVLLQNRFQGLEMLGYQDKVNCLLFNSPKELREKVAWIHDHPGQLAGIAAAGQALAATHTYTARAKTIIQTLLMDFNKTT